MKYTTIKNASEIPLAGVKVDFDVIDKTIRVVNIHDSNGGALRIHVDGYSNYLTISIPAKPEMKKVFRLSGKVTEGVPFSVDFPSRYETENKQREIGVATATVDEIEVPEE